jgi:hypothetical protein
MPNKECKLKICICSGIFGTEQVSANFAANEAVAAVINPTQDQMTAAGIDKVIAASEEHIKAAAALNDALVTYGVKLSS